MLFKGEPRCYTRTYSPDHLQRHPVQQVTFMALVPEPGVEEPGALGVSVRVMVRGDAETYERLAFCEDQGSALECRMEGDAGSFRVARRGDGVLLTVGADGIGFEGARGFIEFSGIRGDDRAFALGRGGPCT